MFTSLLERIAVTVIVIVLGLCALCVSREGRSIKPDPTGS
jgi:hypothetical protein